MGVDSIDINNLYREITNSFKNAKRFWVRGRKGT
jgi:hypothetical protein